MSTDNNTQVLGTTSDPVEPICPTALKALKALTVAASGKVIAKVAAAQADEFLAFASANPSDPDVVAAACKVLGIKGKAVAAVQSFFEDENPEVVEGGSKKGSGMPYGAHIALKANRPVLAKLPAKASVVVNHGAGAGKRLPTGKTLALVAQAASSAGIDKAESHLIYGNGWGSGLEAELKRVAAKHGGTVGKKDKRLFFVPLKGSDLRKAIRQ